MSRFLSIALDHACLQRAAAGDAQSRRQLYEQAAGPVFALVRRLVPGRASAEDVFQDCMIGLLGAAGSFRGEAPVGAWIRQVALRQCLMHLRSPWQRARRSLAALTLEGEPEVVPAGLLQDHAPDQLDDQMDLERALAALPDMARAVVWLHDVEGLTHQEIAAQFGRTTSFSKSQLSRAHALLRDRLGPQAAPAQAVPVAPIAAQGQVP